ncbi:hypothetical protein SynBMKMC1_02616 [Synechococcus sp. BMK-MC-1]|nr:hypothetical protein SynBMKMC1_02616 [Synechococcus sp. BMK-MC-1]
MLLKAPSSLPRSQTPRTLQSKGLRPHPDAPSAMDVTIWSHSTSIQSQPLHDERINRSQSQPCPWISRAPKKHS